MARRNHQVLVGGEGSYEWLSEIAKAKRSTSWSCGKETKAGDFLFIYAIEPDSAIIATASAASDAKPDKKWHFVAKIKNVKVIERPITRREMLKEIPQWGWPQQPRRATYPDENTVEKLLKLASRKGKPTVDSTITINSTGAGFGTAKENREVEKAACTAVKAYFEKECFEVVSREKEKIGYDFDVRRKGEELHVEVKGISGSRLRFPITANEVSCAKSDNKFVLAVVTDAKSTQRKVRVIIRNDFLKHFHIKPLAYFAEAKSSLFQ